MRLMLTAGFDRAHNVIACGYLLRRDGHDIVGLIVVSPYSLKRLKSLIRQRGIAIVLNSIKRLLGATSEMEAGNPVGEFMKEHSIDWRSLKKWATAHRIPYHTVDNLNSPETVRIVEEASPDALIYGGGGILRGPIIRASKHRVLNAHSGPMPQIRGMNACEWSVLLDVPPAVTIHFIDEGIDTGRIIEKIPITLETGDTIDQLRAKCLVCGVEGLRRAASALERISAHQMVDAAAHRQCFVMAPSIRELTEAKLANMTSQVSGTET